MSLTIDVKGRVMTDAMQQQATKEDRCEHLKELSDKLTSFDRELSESRTGVPMLIVTNMDVPQLHEHVLCQHDMDGTLAFFWPWGSRIASITHPDAAAVDVMRVLGSGRG